MERTVEFGSVPITILSIMDYREDFNWGTIDTIHNAKAVNEMNEVFIKFAGQIVSTYWTS